MRIRRPIPQRPIARLRPLTIRVTPEQLTTLELAGQDLNATAAEVAQMMVNIGLINWINERARPSGHVKRSYGGEIDENPYPPHSHSPLDCELLELEELRRDG